MLELTRPEAEIVHALAAVWNLFLDLPEEHPMDRQEFCSDIHRLQEKVLARAGRRTLNAGAARARVARSCPATRPECPHGCTKHDCDALAAAAGVEGRKP